MTSKSDELANKRVLVVEDEYFLADDLVQALRKLGADVVGPAATKEKALSLIGSGNAIDAAVLDINLHGHTVFPIADVLIEQGVPFVFATGYDQIALPEAYGEVPRWEKPFETHELALAIRTLLQGG